MHTAADLIELINKNTSLDYWYDDRLTVACNLLQKLDKLEFGILLTTWQNRSDEWNLRFASILNSRECPATAAILTAIIKNSSYVTALIALTELTGFENKQTVRSVKNLTNALDEFEMKFSEQQSEFQTTLDQVRLIVQEIDSV